MRKPITLLFFAVAGCSAMAGLQARAEGIAPAAAPVVRELYVPFDDLNVLLENQPRRMLMSREEYERLLAQAKARPQSKAPIPTAILAANYQITVEPERAQIKGKLTVEVLDDGLQMLNLDLTGVGIKAASLDGKSAAIGQAPSGTVSLFLEGKGQHTLELDLVAPLATTAAQQVLNFRVPESGTTTMQLTVPGDVEIKSGLKVIGRLFDAAAQQTRFDLLASRGKAEMVMTLNSKLHRKERVVAAKSVVVDEVTQNYERLHATFSMAVLHRAVDSFRLAIPTGFEVTQVSSPLLARWSVTAGQQGERVLDIRLREQIVETQVLNITAVRTAATGQAWTFPMIKALDVVGEVAVLGVLLEDRLQAEALKSEGLIPLDTSVLQQALPASVFQAEPGPPQVRPIVAYYAPQADFHLSASFNKKPSRLLVTTNLLLTLAQKNQQMRGGFSLLPQVDKLFAFDFAVPADWQVLNVTLPDGKSLPMERFAGRVHVRLPQGVPPGQPYPVAFQASSSPTGWLGEWTSIPVAFPAFKIIDATSETGAIAVAVQDDLTVRPDTLDKLTPLDETEKQSYGLNGVATSLAYRFDGPSYQAKLTVERTAARLTAQSYSFFVVKPDLLTAHYEIVYEVEQAKVQRLSLALPAGTPETLSIRGLQGVVLKEYTSRLADQVRHWTILLAEPRRETIRLAVDFQQPMGDQQINNLELPVVRAEDVARQSGFVAVEGSAELDVGLATKLRKVDIGELVKSQYQPGKRLLGAYSFVGDSPELRVSVSRHPGHDLPTILIERAELITVLATQGLSQNAARVLLRTKDQYLEVKLPAGATLWSAQLDGTPARPQREDQRLLLTLPTGGEAQLHDLQFVYEMPVQAIHLRDRVNVLAPTLLLRRSAQADGTPVPVADLMWHVYLPSGYIMTGSDGTVTPDRINAPEPAVTRLGEFLYCALGGLNPFYLHSLARAPEATTVGSLGSKVVEKEGTYRSFWRFSREAPAGPETAQALDRTRPAGRPDSTPHALSYTLEIGGANDGGFGRRRVGPAPSSQPARTIQGQIFTGGDSGIIEGLAGEPAAPAGAAMAFSLGDLSSHGASTKPAEAIDKTGWAETSYGQQVPFTIPAKSTSWALEGVRSLNIQLDRSGEPITFRNLGADPRLSITLLDEFRSQAIGWALACAIGLWGLRLVNQPMRRRVRYVFVVAAITGLVPLASGLPALTTMLNPAFIVICGLVPFYIILGLLRAIARRFQPMTFPAATATAIALLMLCTANEVRAAEPVKVALPMVVEMSEPHAPVVVPPDAIVLPYDPTVSAIDSKLQQMLVPYEKYVELWNRANPDSKLTTVAPPAAYALGGISLQAVLQGDEHLKIEAHADVDVYADGTVAVPVPLDKGVVTGAELDGQPAKLGLMRVKPQPSTKPAAADQQKSQESPIKERQAEDVLVLNVAGKGRHHLVLTAQFQLTRSGGWRVARGRLFVAPAGTLKLVVPLEKTEVRLDGVTDRVTQLTSTPNQVIETALAPDGKLSIQWRPKVSEGVVDQSLTAQSSAMLDVQEDGLRLVWRVGLEFRRSERSAFRVSLPSGYLVTKIVGANVRGWEVTPDGQRQTVEVTLLKPAKDTESFDVHFWQRGQVGKDLTTFDVPAVAVESAALHHGTLFIRRSPLLELRTQAAQGVSRTDLPTERSGANDIALSVESPLGIRPFAAYRFVAMPFSIRLNAAPIPGAITANAQTIVRMGELDRKLEARITLDVQGRSIYQVGLLVPADLDVEQVSAPGAFEWTVTPQKDRKLLSVILTAGQTHQVPILISGRLGEVGVREQMALPQLEVLDVHRQEGDIAVQSDPAFKIDTADLHDCEMTELKRLYEWLTPKQRELTRVALHYRSPAYAGQLKLVALAPQVRCYTVSNAHVTDRAIEETVLLDFNIQQAGIREVAFLLPENMKDARINVPQLRQKTIEPAPADKPGTILVRLQLQDRVMGQLRVLVENDRLFTSQVHRVPIPVVLTGQTDQQYVLMENSGRDEVVIDSQQGLIALDRQQKEWQMLTGMLKAQITSAYMVDRSAGASALTFKSKDRQIVETVGARIGLAETWMSVDASGTYRAVQVCRVANSTEQFLEIQLPAGAQMWTARVANEPVKPTRSADPTKVDHLFIPLVKTAAGDLDYEVAIKYGGRLAKPGGTSSVSFPLIRTVNINAELSQVRLFLPENCRWFDFGGTMTAVEDEASLAAGYVGYQTKQAERLNEAMRGANSFAQVRAAAN